MLGQIGQVGIEAATIPLLQRHGDRATQRLVLTRQQIGFDRLARQGMSKRSGAGYMGGMGRYGRQ